MAGGVRGVAAAERPNLSPNLCGPLDPLELAWPRATPTPTEPLDKINSQSLANSLCIPAHGMTEFCVARKSSTRTTIEPAPPARSTLLDCQPKDLAQVGQARLCATSPLKTSALDLTSGRRVTPPYSTHRCVPCPL